MRKSGDSRGFQPWQAIDEGLDALAHYIRTETDFANCDRADATEAATIIYSSVNEIHPFREGNGRTQRAWLNDITAKSPWTVDWARVTAAQNDYASRAARHGDPRPMLEMFRSALVARDAATRPEPSRSAGRLAAVSFPVQPRGTMSAPGSGAPRPTSGRSGQARIEPGHGHPSKSGYER